MSNRSRRDGCRKNDRGQTIILMVLVMGIFLLGFIGLATDYSNFWYHRQTAQGAADATCQAGAMDLLLYAEDQPTPKMNFTPLQGTPIDCKNAPTAAPCMIASLNGYDGTLATNRVVMTFPRTVAGATPPEGVDVPFIQVDVTEQVPAYFSRLLTANSSVAVSASATCGLAAPAGPVPIVVLHPTTANAISMGGTPDIIIVGGPQRSVQVNSSSATPVSLSNVDLSKAGPSNTGGDFAQFGGNGNPPSGLNLGSTGTWQYPSPPISDPYRSVAPPSTPAAGTKSAAKNGAACKTPVVGCYKVNGCPDSSGCDEYTAGSYNKLSVKNGTAIFDPGVYYVTGGMVLDSNSNVRVSTTSGNGSGGVMFYFSGSGTISVASNSGGGTTDAYRVLTAARLPMASHRAPCSFRAVQPTRRNSRRR